MLKARITLCLLALTACNNPKEAEPVAPHSSPPAVPAAPETSAPSATAAAPVTVAPPSPSAAEPAASKEPEAPIPVVDVKNIGMHIGGGPNDRETKQPIKESVEPHFDAFRKCWRLVDDPAKGGDFGVDLLIPREGGKAEVSHPRTAIAGEGFETCVVEVFSTIEYKRPKTGKTMVSYSLRFTPGT